ncbi:MAG: peptide-methionine (S)-S-oxide reductase MsrA, partial [Aphanocapsa feldmannii 288cV]
PGRTAILAGGCFWCLEHDLESLPGVIEAVSGYSGGELEDPSYRQVSKGETDHIEVVKVSFDPELISYEGLLDAFWRNVDPLDGGGQFCDRGSQYTSAIFTEDDEQRQAAERSAASIREQLDVESLATEIRPAVPFYPAEKYHQNYAKNNKRKYKFYRWGCGRDARLNDLWGGEREQ